MNWGLIGYGGIAPKFLDSLVHVPDQHVYAIASRSNHEEIKKNFPNAKAYNSYAKLLADGNVDIVYISTTHNFHLSNTLDALAAGKHVLCEKPLGVNFAEYEQMVAAARESGLFFMEAIWSRFLPAYREMKDLLRSGAIGDPELVIADFGFKSDAPDDGRLFNPALAGGSVLDVGIYPIVFALDVFEQKPTNIQATLRKYHTGVDASASMILSFEGGKHAKLFSSVVTTSPHDGIICGTEGMIRMNGFWHGQEIEILRNGQKEHRDIPYQHTGYFHEIEEVVQCIKEGRTESSVVTWEDSLLIASVMDQVLSHL